MGNKIPIPWNKLSQGSQYPCEFEFKFVFLLPGESPILMRPLPKFSALFITSSYVIHWYPEYRVFLHPLIHRVNTDNTELRVLNAYPASDWPVKKIKIK